MLGNLKKVLGIEGLKVDVIIPEEIRQSQGVVHGKIVLTTLRDTQLKSIAIKVIEKYSRGRGENYKVNEYVIGSISIDKHITVSKDEQKTIDFELPFEIARSEMDELEDQNFIFKGLVRLAKKLKKVKSEYYVLAEAKEVGAKLSPHIKKSFRLV